MSSVCFIPIRYAKRNYPDDIVPRIQEIAGHFDIQKISPVMSYSLHTEYSFTRRKLNSPLLHGLMNIRNSHERFLPMLWYNGEWSKEFSSFVTRLVDKNNPPSIVEIHPPFRDYCGSVRQFLNIYKFFQAYISEVFPNAEILIENRSGSHYRSDFLITRSQDIIDLSEEVEKSQIPLKLALDFPQLLTAHFGKQRPTEEALRELVLCLNGCRHFIKSIHIWGKEKKGKRSWPVSHCGDLNTYFEDDNLKTVFLTSLVDLLSDDMPRYFVPEINSNDSDLQSIVSDFRNAGVCFL